MSIISRLTDEDVSSRYEALDSGVPGPLFIEYHANDRQNNRAVLVRVLRPSLARPSLLDAMSRSLSAAASVAHPALERLLDIFFVRNTIAVVAEPRRGADLRQRLSRVGVFPVAYSVDIAIAIAEALQTAHRAGVTHGSLEPADVWLSPEGIVKLCGVGVRAAVCSVPSDERPQDFAGAGQPTEAGDVRRFGGLLYRILTARLDPTPDELEVGPATWNSQIPTSLSNLNRCLIAGSGRYPAIDAVLRDLKSIRDSIRTGDPMPAIAPPSAPSNGQRARQREASRGGKTAPERASERETASGHRRRREPRSGSTRRALEQAAAADAIRRAPAGGSQTATRRQRRGPGLRRLTARFLILLTFLALVCAGLSGGAVFYLSYFSGTPEVPVPYLRGKTVDQARQITSMLGLKLSVDPYPVFDAHVPLGEILRQMPSAGTHTKAPRTIRVFLSGGSRTVKVPPVVGQPLEVAVKLLEQSGLKYKNNGDLNSPTVNYGDIVKQWPPPHKEMPRGSDVFLKVSAGPSQQDQEAVAPPSTPQDRNISFTIPGGPPDASKPRSKGDGEHGDKAGNKSNSAGSAPVHSVEIKEIGPAGDEKILWQGKAPAGGTIDQDVTVDPYFELKIILDGKELKTRAGSEGSDNSPAGDATSVDAAASESSSAIKPGD